MRFNSFDYYTVSGSRVCVRVSVSMSLLACVYMESGNEVNFQQRTNKGREREREKETIPESDRTRSNIKGSTVYRMKIEFYHLFAV